MPISLNVPGSAVILTDEMCKEIVRIGGGGAPPPVNPPPPVVTPPPVVMPPTGPLADWDARPSQIAKWRHYRDAEGTALQLLRGIPANDIAQRLQFYHVWSQPVSYRKTDGTFLYAHGLDENGVPSWRPDVNGAADAFLRAEMLKVGQVPPLPLG